MTDSYLMTGIMDPAQFLGKTMTLDRAASERVLTALGSRLGLDAAAVAEAILQVATANMYAQFLPLMARHGVDYQDFALVAFGGAGPTHAFFLAEEVGLRQVVIPPSPGTLCALGCLISDLRSDFVRSLDITLTLENGGAIAAAYTELDRRASEWITEQGVATDDLHFQRSADMRYVGQAFEVLVAAPPSGSPGELLRAFHERYQVLYSYADESAPVEIVNLRVQVAKRMDKPELQPRRERRQRESLPPRTVRYDGGDIEVAVHRREDLFPGDRIYGPAVVLQYDTTTFITPAYDAVIDEGFNIRAEARVQI